MAHFKTLAINSSQGSLALVPLQQFVLSPAARRAGWNLNKMLDLIGSLQTALQRFERMTSFQIRFKLLLTMNEPPKQDELYSIDHQNKNIYVYLAHGPDKILVNVPTMIGQKLGRVFLEIYAKGKAITEGVTFNVIEDASRIEYGLKMIKSFYIQERGTQYDEAGMLAKRYSAAQAYLKCQNVLNGDIGRQLGSIELLSVPDQDIEYFTKYPLETARQLQLAPAGYNVAFNAFVHVFDFYFDHVRIFE